MYDVLGTKCGFTANFHSAGQVGFCSIFDVMVAKKSRRLAAAVFRCVKLSLESRGISQSHGLRCLHVPTYRRRPKARCRARYCRMRSTMHITMETGTLRTDSGTYCVSQILKPGKKGRGQAAAEIWCSRPSKGSSG